MLYTLENVRANIRTRQSGRVFFLGQEDTLTSAARDYLNGERIPILPASQAKITRYRGLDGCYYEEKPEHMTQLTGEILVPKTHPRILFRGKLDALQSELILLALEEPGLGKECGEMLEFVRQILKSEVLEEPFREEKLLGLTLDEIRVFSQQPQKYLGKPHFMPGPQHGLTVARLNALRTQVRQTELAAAQAFPEQRQDIVRGLNRLSSAVYVLMLKCQH
mgnify:CR=1 FL=1